MPVWTCAPIIEMTRSNSATATRGKRSAGGIKLVQPALYLAGMIPAVWTFSLGLADQLGADPMKALERTLGLWALNFLLITLTISPLRDLAGINFLRYRRTTGLLAFFYAMMHLTTYTVLDQGLDFAAIWADIVRRPYITIGMAAFAILVPLAATSSNAMIRRLGGAAWARLHRFVYLVGAAVIVHYLLLVKSWTIQPLAYAAAMGLLLGYRVFKRLRGRRKPRLAPG